MKVVTILTLVVLALTNIFQILWIQGLNNNVSWLQRDVDHLYKVAEYDQGRIKALEEGLHK